MCVVRESACCLRGKCTVVRWLVKDEAAKAMVGTQGESTVNA